MRLVDALRCSFFPLALLRTILARAPLAHPGAAQQSETRIPALLAPPPTRDNPLTRSKVGLAGLAFLACMMVVCLVSLPFALSKGASGVARYNEGSTAAAKLPPLWATPSLDQAQRLDALVPDDVQARLAQAAGISVPELLALRLAAQPTSTTPPQASPAHAATLAQLQAHWPQYFLGTDTLGRSLLWRVLAGGGVSLVVGLLAAGVSVTIGTLYGALAGLAGGRIDSIMMRIVDVLYGLPYVLLVVLLAVASDAMLSEFVSRHKARKAFVERQAWTLVENARAEPDLAPPVRKADVSAFLASNESERTRLENLARATLPPRDLSPTTRSLLDLGTLLIAIGGISWLTMSRVVRGQVMSLRNQPFMEAARALGLSRRRIFLRHLLPNLAGTITVYATLTVPQAILQESFLSFLGIGVKPPLASWGNLAADGLGEINPYQSHWWLPLFPCLLLSLTLLALNFTGEALREALDPKRARRGL